MSRLSREHMQTLCDVFDTFALRDQDSYYHTTIELHRTAASQINFLRAFFAFLGGLASALVLLASQGDGWSSVIKTALIVVAIVSPALGAAFNTLSDLFQWDRLVRIYDDAQKSLVVADAQSPSDKIKASVEYRGHMDAFVEATLSVMREETSQWGQLVQPPQQTEQFIERARMRVEKATRASVEGDEGSQPAEQGV
jgi:hypothetical protein